MQTHAAAHSRARSPHAHYKYMCVKMHTRTLPTARARLCVPVVLLLCPLGAVRPSFVYRQAANGGAMALLTCMVLTHNPIGDSGVEALAKVAADDDVLPLLKELHLRETATSQAGVAALCESLMAQTGGLPALRRLALDESHAKHAKLHEVYASRSGQGGVHALNLDHLVVAQTAPTWHMTREVPLSARTPRVQQSPRFPMAF